MKRLLALAATSTLHVACVDEPELELEVDEAEATNVTCTHYVATTGTDGPGFGTSALPWRTIHYAVNHVSPGARVCVRAGTYQERVDFGVSGTASAPITLMRTGAGEVIVDGTVMQVGYPACPPTLSIFGRSHLRVWGLTITNQGNAGYPGVPASQCQSTGMLIMPNEGRDAEDVIVQSCVFRDIRPARTDQIGLGLGFGSYVSGVSAHHIVLVDNTFRNNDTINETTGIRIGAVAVVGDAHDFLIERNVFDDADTGGVELAGNQGSNTLRPTNGVITDNQFLRSGSVGPFYNAAVYIQGGDHMLIERNYFDRVGIAVSVHTEPPVTPPGTPCPFTPALAGHTWVRNNLMVNTVFDDFRTGANDNGQPCNYASVDSVYVTNNTMFRPASGDHASFYLPVNPSAGLIGDNKFLDNIIITSGRAVELWGENTPVESDYNYVVSPLAQPMLYWGVPIAWSSWQQLGLDTHSRKGTVFNAATFVRPSPAARADFALSTDTTTPPHNGGKPRWPFGPPPTTPSWATFGAYTPATEYDLYAGPRDNSLRRDIGADEY